MFFFQLFLRYHNPLVSLNAYLLQVEEVGLVSELGHLQEVMTQLEKYSADPYTLPPASEQVSHAPRN